MPKRAGMDVTTFKTGNGGEVTTQQPTPIGRLGCQGVGSQFCSVNRNAVEARLIWAI